MYENRRPSAVGAGSGGEPDHGAAEEGKRQEPGPSPALSDDEEEMPRRAASKYHNRKAARITAAGNILEFDSQKEARRYDELALLLAAEKIRDLKLQPEYTLQEAYTTLEACGSGLSGTGQTFPTSGPRSRTAAERSTGCVW